MRGLCGRLTGCAQHLLCSFRILGHCSINCQNVSRPRLSPRELRCLFPVHHFPLVTFKCPFYGLQETCLKLLVHIMNLPPHRLLITPSNLRYRNALIYILFLALPALSAPLTTAFSSQLPACFTDVRGGEVVSNTSGRTSRPRCSAGGRAPCSRGKHVPACRCTKLQPRVATGARHRQRTQNSAFLKVRPVGSLKRWRHCTL